MLLFFLIRVKTMKCFWIRVYWFQEREKKGKTKIDIDFQFLIWIENWMDEWPTDQKSTLITCNICDVKQKVKSTTEQCYIDINVAKVTVTLFHDIIKNLLISQGKHGLPINEDNVTSLFLKLLTLSSSCKSVAKTVKTEQQNKHLFNTCRDCETKNFKRSCYSYH